MATHSTTTAHTGTMDSGLVTISMSVCWTRQTIVTWMLIRMLIPTNTVGSYECECHEGLFRDGVTCLDADECGINGTAVTYTSTTQGDIIDDLFLSHNCSADIATCENEYTSYTCACNEGYYGDGKDCLDGYECGDVDMVTTTSVPPMLPSCYAMFCQISTCPGTILPPQQYTRQ